MTFKPKLTVAVMVALGVVSQAQAQTATTAKTVITGSNIKRIDAEPIAPVEIITRDQIERTGLPTVAEVLRNVPANTGGSFGESFSNSFAPGASGISLRGLGQKATLVLINGRRMTGYGFAQNLQDTFVDLNAIPSSAVERIEILKDGASAIYGSDAIAGVVNIIMRSDYKGIEVSGDYGWFEGQNDYRFGLTGGFGDLAKDRFNVFGVFDYYKRDLLLFGDTKFGSTRDFRGTQGGRNHQSLTGLGTWAPLNAAGTATGTTRRAISECAQAGGTVLTAEQAVNQGLLPFNNATNLPGNTWCSYDINKILTAIPETERWGFLGRGTWDIAPSLQGYAELGYSNTETFQTFSQPFFSTTALRQTPQGLQPFAYNVNFAPGSAGNPFSGPARYLGSLSDLGTRDGTIDSKTARVLAGLKYTFAGWEGDSAVGWSKNEVEARYINRLSKAGVSEAFGVPTSLQPPVPTSTNSSYNLDRPSLNSEAVRNAMKIDTPRESTSELKFVDTKLSTEFGNLPGGPIGVATGGEFRNEKLQDRPDPNSQNGNILGQGITATDAKRDAYAFFAEFALPVIKPVELQAAVRYDHYSDFGSTTNPKFGIKVKAAPSLLLRANWGKGFRAPTLVEISPSVATFFQQVNDPVTNTVPNISGVFAGNPDLKPERSESTTVGFVFEPSADFNMGFNWYSIEWKDKVFGDCCQAAVNAGGPNVIRDPITGTIITVFSNFINQDSVTTRGFDVDAKYAMGTRVGRFTGRMNVSYVDTYKVNSGFGGVETAGTNDPVSATNTIPRVRGFISLDYDQGPIAVTGRMNYTHHFNQALLDPTFFIPGGIAAAAPGDNRFQNGVYPTHVDRLITYDLFVKYNITKNFAITGAVINITDEVPAYDPGYSTTNLYTFDVFDVRGRQFRLGLIYKM